MLVTITTIITIILLGVKAYYFVLSCSLILIKFLPFIGLLVTVQRWNIFIIMNRFIPGNFLDCSKVNHIVYQRVKTNIFLIHSSVAEVTGFQFSSILSKQKSYKSDRCTSVHFISIEEVSVIRDVEMIRVRKDLAIIILASLITLYV